MGDAGSAMSGGDFWRRAAVGGIVAGANHLLHDPPQDGQGKPSLEDLKKGPPNHPEYKAPKSGARKVRNPRGKGTGWIDKNGDIWVPTDHDGSHAPHWDRQHPNGKHTNMYPVVSTAVGAARVYSLFRIFNSTMNRLTPVLMNITIMKLDPS